MNRTLGSIDLRQFDEGPASAVLKKVTPERSKASRNHQYKCTYEVTQGDLTRSVVDYVVDPLRAELEAPEIVVQHLQKLLMHAGYPDDEYQKHTARSALNAVLEKEVEVPVFLTQDDETGRWQLFVSLPSEE